MKVGKWNLENSIFTQKSEMGLESRARKRKKLRKIEVEIKNVHKNHSTCESAIKSIKKLKACFSSPAKCFL